MTNTKELFMRKELDLALLFPISMLTIFTSYIVQQFSLISFLLIEKL